MMLFLFFYFLFFALSLRYMKKWRLNMYMRKSIKRGLNTVIGGITRNERGEQENQYIHTRYIWLKLNNNQRE